MKTLSASLLAFTLSVQICPAFLPSGRDDVRWSMYREEGLWKQPAPANPPAAVVTPSGATQEVNVPGTKTSFLPWKTPKNVAFLPWKTPKNVAFLPWKTPKGVTFLPWKTPKNVAFLPWKTPKNVAFLPWKTPKRVA